MDLVPLIETFGLPTAILAVLTTAVMRGWLVPSRFYIEKREEAAKWAELSTEQAKTLKELSDALKELNDSLSATTIHFFDSLSKELKEKQEKEGQE